VRVTCCANYGIDRTGVKAKSAAYAGRFINDRHRRRLWFAVSRVYRTGSAAEKVGECCHGGIPAWRALINFCCAGYYGFCVWQATRKAALCALGLGEQGIDTFDWRVCVCLGTPGC
jgi:hypothetical protein